MTRFFLHVRDGNKLVEDLEGYDFPDLEAAQAEARQAAREMMADRIACGGTLGHQQIEICDETGNFVATVPFRQVIDPI